MAFNIDRAFAAVKGNIILVKARMQTAMFKKGRNGSFGKRALEFGRDIIRPLNI